MRYNMLHLLLLPTIIFLLSNNYSSAQANQKYNVLFIAVDDLNDWVGPLNGYKGVKTPNIDRLAKQGMIFTRAYCSAPICNPSRASILTGVRPSTSGVYQNQHPWRPVLRDAVTLSQHFMANGYDAYGAGKIFHETYQDSASWRQFAKKTHSPQPGKVPVNGFGNFDWGSLTVAEEEMEDYTIVQHGIDYLQQSHQTPFFLAIGIHKPHLPWYVPKKYFDLYPLESIVLPKVIANDLEDIPPAGRKIAHSAFGGNKPDHQFILENDQWKKAIQGYLASISFADAQIGRLLDALDRSVYKKNTIIVFFGDHGWNLGEKEHWRKFSLWEESTRVPFFIVAPGIVKPNSVCERTVNLMDIYPTLINLCKLTPKPGLDAVDITPLLKNPTLVWDHPSITTYGRNNHSVRTERWHYIRYNDNSEELYDHNADPNEWKNLAADPRYLDTIAKLAVWLPKVNAEPAVDSVGLRRRAQMQRDSTQQKN
ncbi:MAG TPA: sulfatase [Chitinophagaceae bacterium]